MFDHRDNGSSKDQGEALGAKNPQREKTENSNLLVYARDFK